jgi:hypothetical protein
MENYSPFLKKRNLIHIIFPLLLGFLLYLFFHKPNLLLHAYITKLTPIPNYYGYIKAYPVFIFLLNHLPDALWIYSLGIFLFISLDFVENSWLKAALVIILGSLTEVMQLFLPNQFTFDWVDLLINVIILIQICYKYEIKKDI